ncbi:hypothetical protein B0T19DRAFT_83795 [Cercophora scortea]|uniref:Uncharacterized protein n=1 Tax=Cercophora scortea TaxID=314031 RepID=A0AAE0IUX2_9PEZI|nr:hypothetical protein B0T19DRAFT_83795 [Cercophora scortea]
MIDYTACAGCTCLTTKHRSPAVLASRHKLKSLCKRTCSHQRTIAPRDSDKTRIWNRDAGWAATEETTFCFICTDRQVGVASPAVFEVPAIRAPFGGGESLAFWVVGSDAVCGTARRAANIASCGRLRGFLFVSLCVCVCLLSGLPDFHELDCAE